MLLQKLYWLGLGQGGVHSMSGNFCGAMPPVKKDIDVLPDVQC